MAKNRLPKCQRLLALLKAAGPAGIPNADLAAHPEVGYTFHDLVRYLRRVDHHLIETRRVNGIPTTILLQAAPEPEPRPLFALMMAAEKARQ